MPKSRFGKRGPINNTTTELHGMPEVSTLDVKTEQSDFSDEIGP